MSTTLDSFAIVWASAMFRALWQGTLLIAVVYLLSRLRWVSPPVRCALWWLASAKMVLGLVVSPVLIPLLPPPAPKVTKVLPATLTPLSDTLPGISFVRSRMVPYARSIPSTASGEPARISSRVVLSAASESVPETGVPFIPLSPRTYLFLSYAVGVIVQLLLIGLQLRRAVKLVRSSRPCDNPEWQAEAKRLARAMGLLDTNIRLRISDTITSPLMIGLLRPVILLPSPTVCVLSPAELRLVLAHEFAHLRRGDLWLAFVPALARVLFFFYLPVLFACRRYEICREAICDAVAVAATNTPADLYGRLLLRLSGAAQTIRSGRTAVLGVASEFRFLKGRVQMLQSMLQSPSVRRPLRLALLLVFIAALTLIPWKVVAGQKTAPVAAPVSPQTTNFKSRTSLVPSAFPITSAVRVTPTAKAVGTTGSVPTVQSVPSVPPVAVSPVAPIGTLAASQQVPGDNPSAVPIALPAAPEPVAPQAVPAPPKQGKVQPNDDELPILIDVPEVKIPEIKIPEIVIPEINVEMPDSTALNDLVASAAEMGKMGQDFGDGAYGSPKSRYGYILLKPMMVDGQYIHRMQNYGWQGKWFVFPPHNVSQNEFWVKRKADGAVFRIADRATVRMLEDALQPLTDLGAKMGKVGGQMGEIGGGMGTIGAKMGAIGAQMGQIGQQQAAISRMRNDLDRRRAADAEKADRDRMDKEAQSLQNQLDALHTRMRDLQAQMSALRVQMNTRRDDGTTAGMKTLGAQLRELGQQMKTLQPQVFAKMDAITDAAIQSGKAVSSGKSQISGIGVKVGSPLPVRIISNDGRIHFAIGSSF